MTHTQTERERNQIRVDGLFTIELLCLCTMQKINRSVLNVTECKDAVAKA